VRTSKLVWNSLGLLLLVSVVWAQANAAGGPEEAVAALEQKWLQSQKTNDAALLAPLLADNIVETNEEGKVFAGKAAVIADAKSVKWSSAEYVNLKVTVFGNTAIAIGGFNGKGTDAKGKPVDVRTRFTDTWVKMPNGAWECVATQTSPITM